MSNPNTNKQDLNRYGLPRWTVKDVIIVLVLGGLMGVIFHFVFPGMATAACSLMGGQQPWSSLTNGFWMLGGFIPFAVVRKPGALVGGETLAATVAVLLSGQFHSQIELVGETEMVINSMIYVGLMQGMGGEMIFCMLRYANWTLPVWLLGAAGCTWLSYAAGIYVTKCYVLFPPAVQAGIIVNTFLSTAILGGVGCWYLSKLIHESQGGKP